MSQLIIGDFVGQQGGKKMSSSIKQKMTSNEHGTGDLTPRCA
jgi:hypothetical protein